MKVISLIVNSAKKICGLNKSHAYITCIDTSILFEMCGKRKYSLFNVKKKKMLNKISIYTEIY